MVLTPAFGTSPLAALAELLASHDSLRRDADRLVPLLLKPFELPLHLDFRVRLDCTDPSRWPAEMARLRELLQRGAPPPDELACPYPGLIAFGPEQAGLFFGRDRESDEISRLVRQHGFLLVVGPSGSGKSSLVSAGVLPRLRAADGDRWLVRTVRPGAGVSPLASLLGEGSGRGRQRRRAAGHGARDRAAAAVRRPGRSDLRAAVQRGPGPVPGADRPAAPDRGLHGGARPAGGLLRRPDDLPAMAGQPRRAGGDHPAARRRVTRGHRPPGGGCRARISSRCCWSGSSTTRATSPTCCR